MLALVCQPNPLKTLPYEARQAALALQSFAARDTRHAGLRVSRRPCKRDCWWTSASITAGSASLRRPVSALLVPALALLRSPPRVQHEQARGLCAPFSERCTTPKRAKVKRGCPTLAVPGSDRTAESLSSVLAGTR